MRRLKEFLTTVLVLMFFIFAIPSISQDNLVYAYTGDEINVSVNQKNLLDIYLAVGNSDSSLNNFEADLRQQLINRGIDKDNINIQAVETSVTSTNSADASKIFDLWQRYNDAGDWKYENGNIIKTTNAQWSGFYDPDFNSSNYTLELQMRTTNSDDDDMGITFGMNGFSNSLNSNQSGFVYIFGGDTYGYADSWNTGTQWITSNSHATGLYAIDGNNLIPLVDNHTDNFDVNIWYKFKLVVNGKNIKIYKANTDGTYPDSALIEYTAENNVDGSWGFFANSQPYAYFKDVNMISSSTKNFSEVIRESEWRAESSRFIVNAHDGKVDDFSDDIKMGEILSRLGNEDISYVGWGYDEVDASDFIAKNNGNGKFIDKDNLSYDSYSKQIQGIADYVYDKYISDKLDGSQYLLYGKLNSTLVEPVDIQHGTADENWPDGKWKVDHDPDYFENSTGTVPYDNLRLSSMDVNFSETGKYDIYFEDEIVKTLFVHRAPIASFTAGVDGSNNLIVNDNSYDPDFQSLAEPARGIKSVGYAYKETNAVEWISGLPATLPADKNFIIRQVVVDQNDVASNPYYRYVSTYSENVAPIADFNFTPAKILKYLNQTTLSYDDNSYDPKGRAITEREWKVFFNGEEIHSAATPMREFAQQATGKYKITLRVKNDLGVWSDSSSRFVTVIDDKTAPTASSDKASNTYYTAVSNHISFCEEENGSGFSHRFIVLSTSETTPENWGSMSTNPDFSISLDQAGTYYIHYKALDYAGNERTGYFGPYTLVDNEEPGEPELKTSIEYNQGDWANEGFDVTLGSSTDNMTPSDRLVYAYSNDGNTYTDCEPGEVFTVLNNSKKTLNFKVCDENQNCRIISRTYKADSEKPGIPTITMKNPDESEYVNDSWTHGGVNVTLIPTTTDLSGIRKNQYRIDKAGAEAGSWTDGNSHSFNDDGIYTVYFKSIDNAGNESDIVTRTIRIDTENPNDAVVSTSENYSFGDWSQTALNVSFGNATDNLTNSENLLYSYSFNGESYTEGTGLKLTDDGNYTLYFKVCDESGLCSVTGKNFKIDGTRPSEPSMTMTSDGSAYSSDSWTNNAVSVRVGGSTDNLSQIQKYQYRINDRLWTDGTEFNLSESGIYNVYSRSVDYAGNISYTDSNTIRIDTINPAEAVVTTGENYSFGNWAQTELNVSFGSATDNLTSAEDLVYSYSFNGESYTNGSSLKLMDDGNYTIYFKVTDASGLATVINKNFKVDRTKPSKPTTTMTSNEESYSSDSWTNYAVSVSIGNSTDNLSKVQKYQYRINSGEWTDGTEYQLSESGIYNVYSRSVDYAGNISESDLKIVKIDSIPPSAATVSTEETYVFGDWSQTELNVSFGSATDNLTSAADLVYSYSFNGESYTNGTSLKLMDDGNYTIYFKVTDASGLNTVISKNLKVDKTKPSRPTTNMYQAKDLKYDNDTWTAGSVAVTIDGSTDNLSKVQKCQYKINDGEWTDGNNYLLTETGTYNVSSRAVDNAGNISDTDVKTIKIDKTLPDTFEITTVCDTIGEISVTASTTDQHSGMNATAYRVFDGTDWSEWTEKMDTVLTGYDRGEVVNITVEARDSVLNVVSVSKEVTTLMNTDPIAHNDKKAVAEDSGTTFFDVLGNDSDADIDTVLGDSIRVIAVSGLSDVNAGKLTFDETGISFSPNGNYNGIISTEYTIADELDAQTTATLTIIVNAVNDEPLVLNDFFTTNEETRVFADVLANDRDIESELFIDSYSGAAHGTVSKSAEGLVYTPEKDFYGNDSFTYTASDGHFFVSGTVSVKVNNINDEPVLNDDGASTLLNQSISVDVLENDSDIETLDLKLESVSAPQHGTANIAGNKISYSPEHGFVGTDEVVYTVNDNGIKVSATLKITVAYPEFYQDGVTTIFDSPVSGSESDTLIIRQGELGTAEVLGSDIYYTPFAELNGFDSFLFRRNSIEYQMLAKGDENGYVSIIGYGIPLDLNAIEVETGSELLMDLAQTIDSDSISAIEISENPEHGTLSIEGNTLVYHPDENFTGEDYVIINVMIDGEATPYVALFNVGEKQGSDIIYYGAALILLGLYLVLYLRYRAYYGENRVRLYTYITIGLMATIATYMSFDSIGAMTACILYAVFVLINYIYVYFDSRKAVKD